ncbi:hypothetical protein FHS61_000294 [Altererythrobacter atlanticus]|uniref:Uncharacterized protein n=1 Tax=Croceibacterium atlanticum TaxID=1267766 RepID=A0A0F7KSH1_9SPHN|nr:hypothetical protein [Croceibacterium atlanticum]AKH42524.1 hypothetical protein WYH_01484 [Croceibacterium atlanticum]MBB5731301.1 hypothetical protein [Croceibacterium atlanticum]
MNDPKPFASLGATLLARKGGARPAMRPQFATMGALGVEGAKALSADGSNPDLEDLGWNDMGHEEHERREANVLPLTPSPSNPQTEAEARADDELARAEVAQAEAAPEQLAQTTQPEIASWQNNSWESEVSPVAAPQESQEQAAIVQPLRKQAKPKRSQRRRAIDQGRRAAFTLRLDEQRHLKLRLASTVRNRSAQQLVTEALDRFLAELPELDALAAQVNRGSRKA